MTPDRPPPTAILSCMHYHQAHGRHPAARQVPAGQEQVELVTSGRGWIEQGDRLVEVTAGALVWHMPGDRTICRSDWEDPYRCLSVQLAVDPAPPTPRRAPRLSRWPDVEEARRLTREAVRYFVDERFDRGVLLAWIYGRLVFQAAAYHHRAPESGLPAGLSRVLEAIEADYAQPLHVRELADLAGWSVAHLHDMFRRHLEVSPHQALIGRRVRAARERLASTNQPIKQIARECGFSSDAAFCRRFRHVDGQTPAAYRRRYADPASG